MPDLDRGERAAQLTATLADVRRRIADACAVAGRDPRQVTLVAVTKTYPASDVAVLERLGVRDIGESKAQEAQAKRAELADLCDESRLRWHVLGRIQSNKARAIGGFAHAVHSVDRLKLVDRLADGAAERPDITSRPLEIFVQVSLDGDPERGGAAPQDVDALADAVQARAQLRLRGLMAVPPIDAEPGAAFARLRELGARLRERHPGADGLSAGMSTDLEAAIENGSTLVRVGTALLGRRRSLIS